VGTFLRNFLRLSWLVKAIPDQIGGSGCVFYRRTQELLQNATYGKYVGIAVK